MLGQRGQAIDCPLKDKSKHGPQAILEFLNTDVAAHFIVIVDRIHTGACLIHDKACSGIHFNHSGFVVQLHAAQGIWPDEQIQIGRTDFGGILDLQMGGIEDLFRRPALIPIRIFNQIAFPERVFLLRNVPFAVIVVLAQCHGLGFDLLNCEIRFQYLSLVQGFIKAGHQL